MPAYCYRGCTVASAADGRLRVARLVFESSWDLAAAIPIDSIALG